jgi:hypothetical protein
MPSIPFPPEDGTFPIIAHPLWGDDFLNIKGLTVQAKPFTKVAEGNSNPLFYRTTGFRSAPESSPQYLKTEYNDIF